MESRLTLFSARSWWLLGVGAQSPSSFGAPWGLDLSQGVRENREESLQRMMQGRRRRQTEGGLEPRLMGSISSRRGSPLFEPHPPPETPGHPEARGPARFRGRAGCAANASPYGGRRGRARRTPRITESPLG